MTRTQLGLLLALVIFLAAWIHDLAHELRQLAAVTHPYERANRRPGRRNTIW